MADKTDNPVIADELEKLFKLKSDGILSEKEFKKQKNILLCGKKGSLGKIIRGQVWSLISIVFFILFCGLIVLLAEPTGNIRANNQIGQGFDANNLPKCESELALENLEELVRDSPLGEGGAVGKKGIKIIDIENIKTVEKKDSVTVCSADIQLSFGGKPHFIYEFIKRPNKGDYLVRLITPADYLSEKLKGK